MKKFKYLLLGVFIGLILSLPVGAFANKLSLVGSKITGEFTVKVNGIELEEKAIVADNKTFAPVRNFAEKMGGKIIVDNDTKTIDIQAENDVEIVEDNIPPEPEKENPYTGISKEELTKKRSFLVNTMIKQAESSVADYEKRLESPKDEYDLEKITTNLKKSQNILQEYKEDLKLMDEAIELLE